MTPAPRGPLRRAGRGARGQCLRGRLHSYHICRAPLLVLLLATVLSVSLPACLPACLPPLDSASPLSVNSRQKAPCPPCCMPMRTASPIQALLKRPRLSCPHPDDDTVAKLGGFRHVPRIQDALQTPTTRHLQDMINRDAKQMDLGYQVPETMFLESGKNISSPPPPYRSLCA